MTEQKSALVTEWPPIEWDNDDYPTEASIEKFRNFKGLGRDTAAFVRRELKKCIEANCASYCSSYEEIGGVDLLDRPIIKGRFSTGGWAGAEELIVAFKSNIFTSRYLWQWRRGGHYVFEFPKEDEK